MQKSIFPSIIYISVLSHCGRQRGKQSDRQTMTDRQTDRRTETKVGVCAANGVLPHEALTRITPVSGRGCKMGLKTVISASVPFGAPDKQKC